MLDGESQKCICFILVGCIVTSDANQ